MLKILGLLNYIPLIGKEKKRLSPTQQRHLAMSERAAFASFKAKLQKPAMLFLLGLNGLLLVSYLFGVNSYSASGYEIRQMQNKVSDLGEKNRKLKVKVAEANSIANLQKQLEVSNFVTVEDVHFLEVQQLSQK